MRPRTPRLVHVTTVPDSLVFLSGQCAYVREHGWQVTIVSSPGPSLYSFARDEGAQAVPIEMTRSISPVADLRSLIQLVALWRRLRPDIVHAHTPKAGLLSMVSAFVARVPRRIYHIHGLPIETATGLQRRMLALTERLACRLASEVLAVSPSIAKVAEDLSLVTRGKTNVIGNGSINGIDAFKRFNPSMDDSNTAVRTRRGISKESPVVGFAGRLVRDKGVLELAEAWDHIRDEYPTSHLLILGHFEGDHEFAEMIRERLAADNRVHIMGWVQSPETYYSAMNVLALPSYREGFGLAAAEASAMALPVVASRIAGLMDVVEDGLTGTLVDSGDADQLTAALRMYLNDKALAADHGRAGRQRVIERFAQQSIWDGTLRHYDGVAGA